MNRKLAIASAALAGLMAAGCTSHTTSAPRATPAPASTTRHASSSPAAGADLSGACKAFAAAWQTFVSTGDLKTYLNATKHLPGAPIALQGTVDKLNGDVTVYALATKHRVSRATLQADARAVEQNCES